MGQERTFEPRIQAVGRVAGTGWYVLGRSPQEKPFALAASLILTKVVVCGTSTEGGEPNNLGEEEQARAANRATLVSKSEQPG